MSKNNKQEQTEKLFAALKSKNVEEVAAAINAGADIRAKNTDGKSLVQILNTEVTESMASDIANKLSPESKKACQDAIKEEMVAQEKDKKLTALEAELFNTMKSGVDHKNDGTTKTWLRQMAKETAAQIVNGDKKTLGLGFGMSGLIVRVSTPHLYDTVTSIAKNAIKQYTVQTQDTSPAKSEGRSWIGNAIDNAIRRIKSFTNSRPITNNVVPQKSSVDTMVNNPETPPTQQTKEGQRIVAASQRSQKQAVVPPIPSAHGPSKSEGLGM